MIQLKPGSRPSSLNKWLQIEPFAPKESRIAKKEEHAAVRFERVFSDAQIKPFDQIEWERRTAEITDDAGKVIFKQENVEVPQVLVALATKVVVSKYFYGEARHRPGSARPRCASLIHRICRTIADWGIKDGYFHQGRAARFSTTN